MTETFVLRIELGNAAMQTSHDLAAVLRKLADRIELGDEYGRVFDANGNTVGEWEVQ